MTAWVSDWIKELVEDEAHPHIETQDNATDSNAVQKSLGGFSSFPPEWKLCNDCSSGTASLFPSRLISFPRLIDILSFDVAEYTTVGKIFKEDCKICQFLIPNESRPGTGSFYFDMSRKGELVEMVVKSGTTTEVVIMKKKQEGRSDELTQLGENIKNWGRIRDWIDWCVEEHNGPCRSMAFDHTPSEPKFIPPKVIDCVSKRVILSPRDCEYLALSYVWGQHTTQPNDLKSAHQTIQDAITATLNLGFKYLWVDRYCIDQSDESDMMGQIHHMDSVYKYAVCTLIDACGSDSNSGLAGISAPRWPVSESICFRGTNLQSTPGPSAGLWKSPWSTRGWTFQEGLFSKRRLFFTKRQLIFDCSARTLLESQNHPFDSFEHEERKKLFEKENDVAIWNAKMANLETMASQIEQFSKRTLTREEDVIRAFSGAFSAFSGGEKPIFHIWGMPFVPNPLQLLNISNKRVDVYPDALFLSSLEHTLTPHRADAKGESILYRRRAGGFPSWSWTGWKATSVSFSISLNTPKKTLPSCHVQFEVLTPRGTASLHDDHKRVQSKLVKVSELLDLFLEHKTLLTISPVIYITSYANTIRVNRSWSRAESSRHNFIFTIYMLNAEHWRNQNGIETEEVHEVMAVWTTYSVYHNKADVLEGLLLCDMKDRTWEKVGTVRYSIAKDLTVENEKMYMQDIGAKIMTFRIV